MKRALRVALAAAIVAGSMFAAGGNSPSEARRKIWTEILDIHADQVFSIGIVTVAGRVCFGLCADAQTLPDVAEAGEAVGEAFDELLAAAA